MSVVLRSTAKEEQLQNSTIASLPEKKVRIIQPRKTQLPVAQQKDVIKRTAAYCRVSSDSDEQELSFETQCAFYKQKINENPNYKLVDIYADEGITGTSTTKRDDFLRMMKDCEDGKIDLILTKSLPRFARNTLDSIMWIRKLTEWKIDVFFELENLHSLEASEMLIAILSSVAQESSNTKSESVRWGYKRQFEKGKTYLGNLYGYRTIKGVISIVEEEAKVVRKVFDMYIGGASELAIKRYLKENKIKTRSGKEEWGTSVINRMLQNEKYAGDSISGKTYNINFLNQKRLKNTGQRPMYYVENSHPGIISRETFLQAQVERSRRTSKIKKFEYEEATRKSKHGKPAKKNSVGRYSSVNALAYRIICFDCGNFYRRAVWTKRSGEKQPVWRCSTKLDIGKDACTGIGSLKESKLFKELQIIINDMMKSKKNIRKDIAEKVSGFVNPKDVIEKKKKLEAKVNEVDNEISKILNNGMLLVSRGVQDESLLKEHLEQHYKNKKSLTKELDAINQKLKETREVKQDKTMKILDQIDVSVSCLSQDEIAIFIEEIIVHKKHLEVKTVLGSSYQIDISKVK